MLTFFAMEVALGMHLSDLRITSGPSQGSRIVHPRLVTVSGGSRIPDPDDPGKQDHHSMWFVLR